MKHIYTKEQVREFIRDQERMLVKAIRDNDKGMIKTTQNDIKILKKQLNR